MLNTYRHLHACLTGATGFIGGRLLQALLSRGAQVTALVRDPEKLSFKHERLRIVQGDILDRASLKRSMSGQQAVFHLAAWYRIGIRSNQVASMHRINVDGTRNVLECALDAQVERIVYASTIGAMGSSGLDATLKDETHPHDGRYQCEYVKSKHLAHLVARELIKKRAAPVVIVQPGAVYGPGDFSSVAEQMSVIKRGKARSIPNCQGILPYTHVDDVVSGILLAFERGKLGEQYLLTGECLSIPQFYAQVANYCGRRAPMKLPRWLIRAVAWWYDYLPGGKLLTGGLPLSEEGARMILDANWAYASNKAQKELGWQFRSLAEGLPETLAGL